MSEHGGGAVHDDASDPRWAEVPPELAAVARRAGVSLGELLAVRDSPEAAALAPPDHSEQMLLRFVAPRLGAWFDAGRIDAARVAVYVEETAGFADAVVAAAVEISLADAPSVPLAHLGDALAGLLGELADLDEAGLLEPAPDGRCAGRRVGRCAAEDRGTDPVGLDGPAEPAVLDAPALLEVAATLCGITSQDGRGALAPVVLKGMVGGSHPSAFPRCTGFGRRTAGPHSLGGSTSCSRGRWALCCAPDRGPSGSRLHDRRGGSLHGDRRGPDRHAPDRHAPDRHAPGRPAPGRPAPGRPAPGRRRPHSCRAPPSASSPLPRPPEPALVTGG